MSDRLTLRKLWLVWDFEEEELWLNNMAMDGWTLDGVSLFTYTFKRCEPGEYIVRLEMRSVDEAYFSFIRDTGAEYIGRIFQWVYYRRRSNLGAFDLFSDIDSRIEHLEKIARMLRIVGVANIIIGVINSFNFIRGIGMINLLCGCLLMYALGRIRGKEDELKKERSLHE